MKTKLFLVLLTIICGSTFGQKPLHQWSFTNGSLSDTGSSITKANLGAPINVTTTKDFNDKINNAIQLNTNISTGSASGNNPLNLKMGNNFGTDYFRLVLGFNIKTSTNDSNGRIILDQTSKGANSNGYQVSLLNGFVQLKTRLASSNANNFVDLNGFHPTFVADGEWHRVVIQVEYNIVPNSTFFGNLINITVDNNSFDIVRNNRGRSYFRFIESTSELVLGNNNSFTAKSSIRYSDEIDNIEILEDNFANIPDTFFFLRQQPVTLFVDINATGNNNGSSWSNAFNSLQDALDASIPGDQVWVASGTYNPGVNRIDTFFLKNRVKIYGGFNGTETNISDRNILNNITVLSGDVLANDSSQLTDVNDPTRTDNNYRILQASEDNTIDGFTFKGGHASLRSNDFDKGAAIFKTRTSQKLTIKNSKFVNNYSFIQGAIAGIYEVNSKAHSLLVENCEFSGNQSNYGSGFSTTLTARSSTLNVTVTNSLFYNNKAEQIATGNSISGSAFSVLTAGNRVGNIVNVVINNSTITKNNDTATNTGATETGPIMLRSGSSQDQINVTLNNSIITKNTNVGSTKPSKSFARGNSSNKISSLIINNSKVDETASGGFSGNSLSSDYTYIIDVDNFEETNALDSSTTVSFNNFNNNNFNLAASDVSLIDTGDNNLVPTGVITDLLGNNRIFNDNVDLGCFEFKSLGEILSTNNIVDKETLKLNVYPNPTTSFVTIEGSVSISNIKIIDLNSKVITQVNNQNTISTVNLPQGIYFLKITNKQGQTKTVKLIKK